MKILKYLLIALGALFTIYLILCAIGPKEMKASKSMLMNAAPQAVFEEYADFANWSGWSPWHKMDTSMKSTITGEPGSVGHKQVWQSTNANVGNGSQVIVEIRPNQFIKSEMYFMGEDASPALGEFTLKPEGEGTLATWSMDGGETPFMMRGMMKLMNFQAIIEEQFNNGLTDLKRIAEAKPKVATGAFQILEMGDQHYLGMMHKGLYTKDITPDTFAKDYGMIAEYIAKSGKQPGLPISIAHNFNQENMMMDMENAMLTEVEMKGAAGMTSGIIPAGKMAKYVYFGPYDQVSGAWGMFMSELMKDHKPRWSGYEVYVNDPTTTTPDKYETWLMQPIE
jgi:effector-binding domain-containing protein